MSITRQDLQRPAMKAWHMIAVGSLILWAIVVLDTRISELITGREPINQLVVRDLYFENGRFHQIVSPTEQATIMADWSASIRHGSEYICSGAGRAPYEPKYSPLVMLPNEWTGGKCALVDGVEYTATAVWVFIDNAGARNQIDKQIDLVYLQEGDT